MQKNKNDEAASVPIRWIESGITFFLVIFALFAPHSIAVTQSAWLLGMVLWVSRFAFFPRPRLFRTPLDYVLLGFFLLSGLSALCSYEPIVSIGKMRAASLFTIVYLFAENIRSLRLVRLLALALIASSMVSVLLTAGQLAFGKGVKVHGIKPESPLTQAVFHTRTARRSVPIMDGDIIWEINGKRMSTPDEVAAALAAAVDPNPAKMRIYRLEWTPELEVPRGRLLAGGNALEQLGISTWTRGRDWRATGFFGHWVTYAEVLQLLASLALGIFLALPKKRSLSGLLLLVAVGGLGFALALTVTRASWVGFAVSAALMLLFSASRRMLLVAGALAIPLVLGSLILLQQKRSVGFFDSHDQSTTWRETVWKEGFHLLISNPRHLVIGVGMDSIKSHWREWGLFDQGRLPMGHMHSNLLEIALERGVPALIMWLVLLGVYARLLFKIIRRKSTGDLQSSLPRGIALGALGGLAGFFTSGLVHYNWGDSEVVMVFYFIMGLCLVIDRFEVGAKSNSSPSKNGRITSTTASALAQLSI